MLCSYGCGKEGKYILKNGKHCCEKFWNSCPINKKKNSEAAKKSNKFTFNANKIRSTCKWCGLESNLPTIRRHEKSCYLNPLNIKICPVCFKPIKDYKKTETCSHACANTYFRSGPQNPNWKETSCSYSSYRKTCFFYFGHKCAICDEKNLVTVHHIDGDRQNNKRENLIPLCPTHHYYIHWGLNDLIQDKIDSYLSERNKYDSKNVY